MTEVPLWLLIPALLLLWALLDPVFDALGAAVAAVINFLMSWMLCVLLKPKRPKRDREQ